MSQASKRGDSFKSASKENRQSIESLRKTITTAKSGGLRMTIKKQSSVALLNCLVSAVN